MEADSRAALEAAGLGALTSPAAVFAAMAEYDAIRRDAFLAKYGCGRARAYVLRHDGREYDSKAIAGAALPDAVRARLRSALERLRYGLVAPVAGR